MGTASIQVIRESATIAEKYINARKEAFHEAGEAVEPVKKYSFQGHELDKTQLKNKEMYVLPEISIYQELFQDFKNKE